MEKRKVFRRIASVSIVLQLLFSFAPYLTGSSIARASSPNYPSISHASGSIVGIVGGVSYQINVVDSDSPESKVVVDILLDSVKVDTQITGNDVTNRSAIRSKLKTTKTGQHVISFRVHDIDSSGNQTGYTFDYSGHQVNIRSVDSVSSSEIEITRANCKWIDGKFPNSYSNSLQISKAQNGSYTWGNLGTAYYENQYFTISDKQFLSGTVYAKITISDGTNSKTLTKEIKVADHTYDSGTVTTPATCTDKGVLTYKCTTCQDTYDEPIPALGHDWDTGKVTKAATGSSDGVMTYTCKRCSTTKTSRIPKTSGGNKSISAPAKVKLTAATVKGTKLTVKWKRVSINTKGYEICLKNKSNRTIKYYYVKQKKKTSISKVIGKLKKKNVYAVRIRAYNEAGGVKVYGPWSKVKSGKIK